MNLHSKGVWIMLRTLLKDEAATDQVVGEVTAHQAYNRYGPRER
jgi:hypothetical protein